MNIQYKTEPFEHVIIENLFDEKHWQHLTGELENILHLDMFNADTGSAKTGEGEFLKENKSVWLENLPDYKKSAIYESKFVLMDTIEKWLENTNIDKKNWYFYNMKHSNTGQLGVRKIGSLISYYGNNANYKDHIDTSMMTALTWYYREPKKFTGGELVFKVFDNYTIPCKNHTTVLFPSLILHKVNQVKVEEDGYGRFTLTNFWNTTSFKQ